MEQGSAAGAAASLLVPGAGQLRPGTSLAAGMAVVDQTIHELELSKVYAKRDLVNMYVWTADRRFFSEFTGNTQVQTEVSSGLFGFMSSSKVRSQR